MTERKRGRRRGILALLIALSMLMGASSIRYLFCATIPAAAAAYGRIFSLPGTRARREKSGIKSVFC